VVNVTFKQKQKWIETVRWWTEWSKHLVVHDIQSGINIEFSPRFLIGRMEGLDSRFLSYDIATHLHTPWLFFYVFVEKRILIE